MFPVEEKTGEIAAALAKNRDVVLTAPPGSGKTTCVPPALLDAPWLKGKKIVMLEPRRIAARTCAQYIAKKRGESVGETVGYSVRLERKVSAKTRLEIVTEGLLTNRIMADPELGDVGLVIFDEFHERSLQCDLAFALALEVRRALRPDLRLLVMSATLDADEIAAHLGDADIVRAEGRMFPVETVYLGDQSVPAAVAKALKETDGDVLCFLPGEGEIRKTLARLSEFQTSGLRSRIGGTEQVRILPLYGSLPKEEQDRVFEPVNQSNDPNHRIVRKVVLATSIAETSVTIEGVTAVVDSGLMRVPRFSPSTGMSGLVTLPLTQDRAEQRRGRAGRVRAGVCYRLWTEGQQQSRPKKMMPEILEADLCSLVLTSIAWGALGCCDLPWLTPPAASAWEQAVGLLKLLGALDADGRLTPKGERMAKLPMHPRLANMMCYCFNTETQRHREVTCSVLAAILEEGGRSRETDVRKIFDRVVETPDSPIHRRIFQLSKRFLSSAKSLCLRDSVFDLSEGGLLALAYPDRIAKNRGNGTFRMVNGRGAFLPEDDPMAKEQYVVCCELDDRTGDAKVFLGCPIAEEEVVELFGGKIVEEPYCAWDRQNDCVKCVMRRKLGEMVVGEKPQNANLRESGELTRSFLGGVKLKGIENLPCWGKESLQLRARINFLNRTIEHSEHSNTSPWPRIDEATLLSALEGFVGGMTKWKDLEKLDIAAVMDFILSEAGHDRRELDRLAPTRMEVPSGSHMTIHYEGDEPTVEVRLQECFGLMETPKVAGGTVPVVMTLLSPAQRPIQITRDLAGFWKGAYQLVRKDMRGRYPKHYWPEDPFTAVATRRVRPR